MFKPKHNARTWGFRFSLTDALAIFAFMSAAGVLWRLGNLLWWMLAIAAAHFFLFCNVFRIVRRRELVWSGLFILNVGVWAWLDLLANKRVRSVLHPIDLRRPQMIAVKPRLFKNALERIVRRFRMLPLYSHL